MVHEILLALTLSLPAAAQRAWERGIDAAPDGKAEKEKDKRPRGAPLAALKPRRLVAELLRAVEGRDVDRFKQATDPGRYPEEYFGTWPRVEAMLSLWKTEKGLSLEEALAPFPALEELPQGLSEPFPPGLVGFELSYNARKGSNRYVRLRYELQRGAKPLRVKVLFVPQGKDWRVGEIDVE